MGSSAPVEYAVAVDLYLDQAPISGASRRVYRISLASWAWPLVGKPAPRGAERRGAAPPVAPLALLDDPGTSERLAAEFAARAAAAGARSANRELSALRSAGGWWREQGWIQADPAAGLRLCHPAAGAMALTASQVDALFRLPASLREHALWRVLQDSGAPAAQVLALDADQLDLARHRVRPGPGGAPAGAGIAWREGTSQVLRWLLSGRTWGPVFVTGRRAPARAADADLCRVTGHARMSYRRAAEVFTELTRPLDTAGEGWTLHQLSAAGRAERAGRVRAAGQAMAQELRHRQRPGRLNSFQRLRGRGARKTCFGRAAWPSPARGGHLIRESHLIAPDGLPDDLVVADPVPEQRVQPALRLGDNEG